MFIWETVLPISKKSCLSKIQEVKAQEDDCAWDQAFTSGADLKDLLGPYRKL